MTIALFSSIILDCISFSMKLFGSISWISGNWLWILMGFSTSLVLLGSLLPSHFQIGYFSGNYSSRQILLKGSDNPPVFAYWIYGSNGDSKTILRLLKAIYHPRNQYLLQLDACSSNYERGELALSVQSEKVFKEFGNVNVIGKSIAFNHIGSSGLAATLHAAALLLKISMNWDWFITLSASDYPLLTQDDLLHAFTFFPRDLNLINYTSNTAWKEKYNINQIVVDPSLYFQKSTPVFNVTENRTTPDAFDVFGGSSWMILTRPFIEYCVNGWENLPRKLLMYFSNVAYPLEYYFHTVICNSPEFQNATIDIDLIYDIDQNIQKAEGESINISMSLQYEKMVASAAAFARPFKKREFMLDMLDQNVLNRPSGGLVAGEWCFDHGINISIESPKDEKQGLCLNWEKGNINSVKPGSHGVKLGILLSKLAVKQKLSIGGSKCQFL